jgi:hypothetical protein
MTATRATTHGRTRRWRAQLWWRRGLRTVRRHYGSLITVGVLGVALAVALTSSSFTSGGSQAGEEAAPPASKIQLTPGYQRNIAAAPGPRVTYYLYEDEQERAILTDILRRDFTNMRRMGLPNYIGEVHFLRVSTDLDEAYLSYLYNEVVALAKADGLTVNIVDLRD